MTHRRVRFATTIGVPDETLGDKVNEEFVVALEYLCEGLCARTTSATFRIDNRSRCTSRIEEELLARAPIDEILVGQSKHFHNASELFLLVLAREDGVSSEHFCENAAETPHIDRHVVIHAKNDLWRPVESGLNVRVHFLVLEAAGAKVDHLDRRLGRVLEQDILWLEIAVHDTMKTKKRKRGKNLDRKTTNERGRESSESIRLDEFVKIDTEQLRNDAEMRAKGERVDHTNDVVLLLRIPLDEILEHFDLDKRLVVKSLLVADDLDGYHLSRTVISTLEHLSKGSLAENVDDLVAVQNVIVRNE